MKTTRVMHAVGTAMGMGLVGGAVALTVAVAPAQADAGHGGGRTRTHDHASNHGSSRPARVHRSEVAKPNRSEIARAAGAAAPAKPADRSRGARLGATTDALSRRTDADKRAARREARTPVALPVSVPAAAVAPTMAQKTTETVSSPAAGTAVAVTTAATAAVRKPTLLNFVGSLIFNVLGVVMQWFAGKPVLPKGSTVAVEETSMTMPDTGQVVNTDWYFPQNASSSTRLIYFQHGFMAVNSMYSYTLATIAEKTGSIIVAPTLSSNAFDAGARWLGGSADQRAVADLFVGDREALTASARAAGFEGTLPSSFVLVGHSLGGALVTSAAGYLADNGAISDLQGVVLLDSVDLNNVVPTALGKLTGVNYRPVYDVSSEPYVWNINGLVGQELQAARPGQFNGVMLQGGRHIDGLQGANPILQGAEYLIAGQSSPQNVAAVRELAIGWINDMFAGSNDGIYGSPQQTIEIPTSAGDATAVAFPFSSTTPIQATPWDGIAKAILDNLLQFAVYEPLGAAPKSVPVVTSV